eukprot:5889674-Prymnesium_polylepis.1
MARGSELGAVATPQAARVRDALANTPLARRLCPEALARRLCPEALTRRLCPEALARRLCPEALA